MTAPRRASLRTILFTEALERFAFVGMQSMLVLYLVKFLLRPGQVEAAWPLVPLARWLGLSGQALAAAIVGSFSALIYLAPVGGGIITDRWLGQRRAVQLGGILLATGYFLLAMAPAWLPGLAFLVVGTGFYKGAITAQVDGLHAANDPRRAEAFQLFFLAVALASIAAPLLIGSLGERIGWSTGFVASGIAMTGAVLMYGRGGTDQSDAPAREDRSVEGMSAGERRRIAVLLLLLPLIVQPNFQMSNAYLVWGDRSFELVAFGTRFPASWLLTLDAVIGTVMLVAVTLFWRWWRRHRPEPDELTKLIIGGGFTLLGTLALVVAAASADADGSGIELGWPVAFHALNDIGMALILPVLIAFATKLAPAGWKTTVASLYFLALFAGGLLASWLGTRFVSMAPIDFWGLHAGLALVATLGFVLIRVMLWQQARP